HGAQYLDQSEHAAALAAIAPAAVAPWDLGGGRSRLVGTPGMAALPKALAKGLDVSLNTRVTALRQRGARWEIDTETDSFEASHVIITIPAPQIGPIIGETHPVAQAASNANMLSCFTLMAAFDQETPTPFVTLRDADAILTWIARNDTKPERPSKYRSWVAQASPQWSATHLNADREETKAQMLEMLCAALGVNPNKLRHAGLQAWRYGLVAEPLGRPFVSHGTLWAGGDWCCGSKAQDAWYSGTQIAHSILQTLDFPAAVRAK
ncbi:MAG: FAD-dependent oxidoreductase, partial [Pseudomonadota bacterium]